jgi:hypothetical protein
MLAGLTLFGKYGSTPPASAQRRISLSDNGIK